MLAFWQAHAAWRPRVVGGAWPGGLGIAQKLLAGTGQTALGLTLARVEVSYIVWSSLPAEINIALELRLFLHPLCSVCSQ